MSKTFSVLITGVGGQGILTVSKVIAVAASRSHAFVSRTESRGLSQRGGAVSSEVRFGDEPVSPVIGVGGADVILALDSLEATRSLPLLKADGTLITNEELIIPLHLEVYWREKNKEQENAARLRTLIFERIKDNRVQLLSINPKSLSDDTRVSAEMNCVILGAASVLLPVEPESLTDAVAACVKKPNALSAFAQGRYFLLKQFIDNGPTFDRANEN